MAKKIYVGNISPTTTDKHLFDHFSKVGKVVSASVVKSVNTGKNYGYGYVLMGNDLETVKAIKTLHNSILEGSRIRVIEAHPMDQEKKSYYYRRG